MISLIWASLFSLFVDNFFFSSIYVSVSLFSLFNCSSLFVESNFKFLNSISVLSLRSLAAAICFSKSNFCFSKSNKCFLFCWHCFSTSFFSKFNLYVLSKACSLLSCVSFNSNSNLSFSEFNSCFLATSLALKLAKVSFSFFWISLLISIFWSINFFSFSSSSNLTWSIFKL